MKTKILFFLILISNLNSYAQNSASLFRFGNGGGFTGISSIYLLNKNGEIFKEQINGKSVFLKKIAPKKLSKFIKNAKKINLATYQISNPGNIYFFLTYESNTLTWGGNSVEVPKKIISLYNSLLIEVSP